MKKNTAVVINELNTSNFRQIIATGDNIFTSICVAKKCKIINRDEKTIYAHTVDYNKDYEKVISWEQEGSMTLGILESQSSEERREIPSVFEDRERGS